MANIKDCHSKVITKTDIPLLEDNLYFVKIAYLAQRHDQHMYCTNVIRDQLPKLLHITGTETVGLVAVLMYPK